MFCNKCGSSDTEYAGVPYFPYIVIRPSEVKNSENLKLIYTHESFSKILLRRW